MKKKDANQGVGRPDVGIRQQVHERGDEKYGLKFSVRFARGKGLPGIRGVDGSRYRPRHRKGRHKELAEGDQRRIGLPR